MNVTQRRDKALQAWSTAKSNGTDYEEHRKAYVAAHKEYIQRVQIAQEAFAKLDYVSIEEAIIALLKKQETN